MSRYKTDIVGTRKGLLTIVKQVGKDDKNRILWLCKCDCGNERIVSSSGLHNINSCGCAKFIRPYENLLNKKFNRLLVVEDLGNKDHKGRLWKCICDCGKSKIARGSDLRSSKIQSCGCLQHEVLIKKATKHNLSDGRIYHTYNNIIARCTRPSNSHYKHYGGRGITICDEWLGKDGFVHFKDWAFANGYKDNLTIERINVNGNYEPSNCTWITNEEQANNRRTTHWITYNGETLNITQWSKKLNISRDTIKYKLSKGITFEEIVGGANNG